MALIWGTKSLFPCPICLVPKEEMSKGSVGALRTTGSMEQVYEEAYKMDTVKSKDEHTKKYGLQYVKVYCILLSSTKY